MKKLWFKNKTYGYGRVPATWQGWLIILLYIIIVIRNFLRIDAIQHSGSDTLINFVPQTFLLTIILFVVCYKT